MVFTCLTGFQNKLNKFQQKKVHIEIFETKYGLSFLTGFADLRERNKQKD